MLHSSTQKLIDRLAEMTELGKLEWAESDSGNVVYSTEGYSVYLTADTGEVIITSIDGKELERASTADLAAAQTETGTSYTSIVAEMMTEAVRLARGTETAISTLLAGMDEPAEAEPDPEPAAVLTPEAPEDAVNETTALTEDAEEPEVEVAASVETVADIEPEAELEAEAEAEVTAETEIEVAPAEAVETEMEADDTPEAFADSEDAPETPADEEAAIDEAEPAEAPEVVIEATEIETAPEAEASETDAAEPSEEATFEASEPEVAASSASDLADTDDTEQTDVEAAPLTGFTIPTEPQSTESEAELTEAVARLADEVNGRDEPAPTPAPAPFVAPAFTGFGSTQTDAAEPAEPEAPSEPEIAAEPEPETVTETESAAPVAASAYVPFGAETTETETETETPVETEAQAQTEVQTDAAADLDDSGSDTIQLGTDAVSEVSDSEPATAPIETVIEAAPAPEIVSANAPEFAETEESVAESDPSSEPASETETESAAPAPFVAATDSEPETDISAPVEEIEAEAEPDEPAAPQSSFTSPFGAFMKETPQPAAANSDADPEDAPQETLSEPEPDLVEASAEEIDTATPEDTAPIAVEAEPEPEKPAPSYSLSGIGAGFGLGALSAKVEASGIPGPSTLGKPSSDNVVIDATDDVLPEAGDAGETRELETASADIRFGSSQTGDSSSDRPQDQDILKPRTRFNPWD